MTMMKVVINPNYESLRAFIEDLPVSFVKEGTVVYSGRNLIKRFELDGLTVNVKCYHKPMLINRLAYTFLRPSKANRAYDYALRLMDLKVATPAPIAYIEQYNGGLLAESYFVSIQVPSTYHTIYEIAKGGLDEYRDVYDALGKYTADLHKRGVYHKDYSPGNILYCRKDGEIEFVLIDINRMRFGHISFHEGCANFARIWGSEAAFRVISASYAEATGNAVDETTDMILRYRSRFWKRYSKRHPVEFEM